MKFRIWLLLAIGLLVFKADAQTSMSASSIGVKTARLTIPLQTINNAGAPWDQIDITGTTFDQIGGTVSSGFDYIVPDDGVYEIISTVNYLDNNSPRVAHRQRYLINGVVPTGYNNFEGHNYMRDATGHDSAANVHSEIYELDAGDEITLQAQTNSSQANTTTIIASWVVIKKLN